MSPTSFGFRRVLLLVAALANATSYAQVEPRSITPAKALHEPAMDNFADAAWETRGQTGRFLSQTLRSARS